MFYCTWAFGRLQDVETLGITRIRRRSLSVCRCCSLHRLPELHSCPSPSCLDLLASSFFTWWATSKPTGAWTLSICKLELLRVNYQLLTVPDVSPVIGGFVFFVLAMQLVDQHATPYTNVYASPQKESMMMGDEASRAQFEDLINFD